MRENVRERLLWVALGGLLYLLFAGAAHAIDFTATGTILTVTYTEPTQNTDGTALDDLAKTSVYYQVGTAAEVKGPDIPASGPTGGAPISTQITCLLYTSPSPRDA